jgi:RNase P/RNase MRP subunit POP5
VIKRVKRRYLLLRIDSAVSVEEGNLKDAVWNAVTSLFGEYGASQAGLFFVKYDRERKEVVLRCSLKALEMVHASIVSITRIRNEPTTIHVLRVSGTIRALSRKSV